MLLSISNLIYTLLDPLLIPHFLYFIIQLIIISTLSYGVLPLLSIYAFIWKEKKTIIAHLNIISLISLVLHLFVFVFFGVYSLILLTITLDVMFYRMLMVLNYFLPRNNKLVGQIGLGLSSVWLLIAYYTYTQVQPGETFTLVENSFPFIINTIGLVSYFCYVVNATNNLLVYYVSLISVTASYSLALLFGVENNLEAIRKQF